MQVRAGRLATVADRRDLLTGPDLLSDLDAVGVDVPVDGGHELAVADVVENDPLAETAGLPALRTVPSAAA